MNIDLKESLSKEISEAQPAEYYYPELSIKVPGGITDLKEGDATIKFKVCGIRHDTKKNETRYDLEVHSIDLPIQEAPANLDEAIEKKLKEKMSHDSSGNY